MNGLGRRISASTFGIGLVCEGAIQDEKEMNGFGRFIRVSGHNKGLQYYCGWWRGGQQCGYGKRITKETVDGNSTEKVEEGLFEDSEYIPDKSNIATYDPDNDLIAKKIDFDKYVS